jgi:hypothetical protein
VSIAINVGRKIMPAVSRNQRKSAGMALAAKRGKIPVSKLKGSARQMYNSMSAEQLGHFAETSEKDLPIEKAKRKVRKWWKNKGN